MSFTISINNEIKNIKESDAIQFYDGINVLCGVNGSGKTNFLELIANNQIINSYQPAQISYINVNEVSSIVSNQHNYHQPKQLSKLIDIVNIDSYLTSFIDISSQLAPTTKVDDYISHYKEQSHINTHLNNEFMITIDYLDYLIKQSKNILDVDVLKKRSLFDDYSRTGRVHKLLESPISNKFAEKCIAFYKYKSFLALQELENAKLENRAYNEQSIGLNIVSIYGKETAPYEELNSCFEKYGFNSRLIPPRNDDTYTLRFAITGTEREIGFNELSTGEKIIVIIMTFITFEKNQIKLLLIDELDAYLNPQMSNMLMIILRDFVVDRLQIDVRKFKSEKQPKLG